MIKDIYIKNELFFEKNMKNVKFTNMRLFRPF